MIRENEVCSLIQSEIPALAADLSLIDKKMGLYKSVTCLADYTKDMIREHHSSEAKVCFKTAYELLQEGSSLVKIAVVNIYIHSVSRLLEGSFCPEQNVRTEFLRIFGKEYCQLVYAGKP